MARVYKNPQLRSATGKVVWCIDYHDPYGKRCRERTSASTKEMAQKILRKRLDEVENAKLHGLATAEPKTMKEFLPEYFNHVDAVRSDKSKVKVRSLVKSFMKRFGSRTLSKIGRGDVQRWVDSRTCEHQPNGKPYKPSTVVTEFVCLSAMFREALKRGHVVHNPCRGIVLPRVNNIIERFLSQDEEDLLLPVCTEELWPIVITAIYVGIRKEEILSVRRTELDLTRAELTVAHGKGDKKRYQPLIPDVVKMFRNLPRTIGPDGEESPYVFNNPETGTRWVDIKKQWARAKRLAGIKSLRFHDLRHTYASRLIQRGVPLKTVQLLLGHTDSRVTDRYAHLAPSDLRDAVNVLSFREVGAEDGTNVANDNQIECAGKGQRGKVLPFRRLVERAMGFEPTTFSLATRRSSH